MCFTWVFLIRATASATSDAEGGARSAAQEWEWSERGAQRSGMRHTRYAGVRIPDKRRGNQGISMKLARGVRVVRNIDSRAVRCSANRIVCREPEGTSKHINQLSSRSASRPTPRCLVHPVPRSPLPALCSLLSALCSPLIRCGATARRRLTRGILPPGHFEELLDVGDLLGLGLSATTRDGWVREVTRRN